jgi:hypothetical protein
VHLPLRHGRGRHHGSRRPRPAPDHRAARRQWRQPWVAHAVKNTWRLRCREGSVRRRTPRIKGQRNGIRFWCFLGCCGGGEEREMICGESEEYLWVTSLVAVAADGFVRRWAGEWRGARGEIAWSGVQCRAASWFCPCHLECLVVNSWSTPGRRWLIPSGAILCLGLECASGHDKRR